MNRFENYESAVAYLFAQIPMYTRIGSKALRPSLDNITAMCAHMGHPQRKLKCIHVAGSNGKGSTSHILAATLQKSGYKTGLYTSPHLVDIRERFRVNGVLVAKELVLLFMNTYIDAIEAIAPSYFELNVALAFFIFENEQVDYAVIETGLGGRWDATNIIIPCLSVITNISLEHTAILGNTLEAIAAEKAGIIKAAVPVVIGETQDETEQVFFLKAHHLQSPITYADARWDVIKTGEDAAYQYFTLVDKGARTLYHITTDLKGAYQSKNIVTAMAAVQVLRQKGAHISTTSFIEALKDVKGISGLRGRWETIALHPQVIIDVAHNPAGMEFLKANLASFATANKLHFVMGFANDKDVANVLPHFPKDAAYYFTQASVPRAMPLGNLQALAEGILDGTFHANVGNAIEAALHNAKAEDIIIVTGSFFVVADALIYFNEHKF